MAGVADESEGPSWAGAGDVNKSIRLDRLHHQLFSLGNLNV